MIRFQTLFTALVCGFLLHSCSTVETATTKSESVASVFPSWYNTSGILVDSTTVSGYATAIGSDSTEASKRAADQSALTVEVQLGNIAEKIRMEMENNDHPAAKNKNAILILRTANAGWAGTATLNNTKSVIEGDMYRAFAVSSLSKAKVRDQWQAALKGESEFFSAFTATSAYLDFFGER